MICTNCGHTVETRANGALEHTKTVLGTREPESKVVCDALYSGRVCMHYLEGKKKVVCKCQTPVQGGSSTGQTIQRLGNKVDNILGAITA